MTNEIHHIEALLPHDEFSRMYISARQKEGRIYSDRQVASLPDIEPFNIHFREWRVRKRSAKRLYKHLEAKQKPLNILEVGCGNGWLCALLSRLRQSTVTGIDVNTTELLQAGRVFSNKKNVCFYRETMYQVNEKFDVIFFAASIQYFPSLIEAVSAALSLLNRAGEVHVLDTHFYQRNELEEARQRTLSHYRGIGHEELSQFYFHHDIVSLSGFNWRYLFNPSSLLNRVFKKNDIFPWIVIEP